MKMGFRLISTVRDIPKSDNDLNLLCLSVLDTVSKFGMKVYGRESIYNYRFKFEQDEYDEFYTLKLKFDMMIKVKTFDSGMDEMLDFLMDVLRSGLVESSFSWSRVLEELQTRTKTAEILFRFDDMKDLTNSLDGVPELIENIDDSSLELLRRKI